MIRWVITVQKLLHRRDKIIGHGATNAAIGQLNHVVFCAGLNPAPLEDVAVHAEITKLIDDQRDAFAVGILKHMTDQGGLTGP